MYSAWLLRLLKADGAALKALINKVFRYSSGGEVSAGEDHSGRHLLPEVLLQALGGFHRELWLSLPSPNSFMGVCSYGGNDSQKMAFQGKSLPSRCTTEAELRAFDQFFLHD